MKKIILRMVYLWMILALLTGNSQVSAAQTTLLLPAAASETVSFGLVSRLGGVSKTIAVQGNYAYVGQGVFILVFDVSNPNQPLQIARIDLNGSATTGIVSDIQIVNNLAYIAYGTGLKIVNIANPAAPVVIGSVSTPGWMVGVAVAGNYAYLAESENGLRVVDITNPASPQSRATLDTPGYALKTEIFGTILYIADQQGGLRMISIVDPLHPVEIGAFQPTGIFVSSVAVTGNIALIVDRGEVSLNHGLRVVNIANPAHPVQIQFFPINWAHDIILSGDLAYLVSVDTIYTYNLLDPSNPLQVSTSQTKYDNWTVVLQANRLYLTSWVVPLQIFDISKPTQPVALNTPVRTSFPANDVTVVGSRAYVAGWYYGGVQIIDVADPATPRVLGIYHPEEWLLYPSLTVAENIIYLLASNSHNLILIDASDPANPTQISQISVPGTGNRVKVAGGYAYVAAGENGLVIFDVTDPYAPVQVGMVDSPGNASDLEVIGQYVYLADRDGGLRVIDISTPDNPLEVGSYASTAQVYGLAATSSTVYLASDFNGLEMINITDPAHPAKIGGFTSGGPARDVALEGNVAYIADQWVGMVAVDVSNPSAPVILGSPGKTGDPQTVDPAGGYVYIADRDNGLTIVKATHTPAYNLSGQVRLANSQPLAGVTLTNSVGYSLISDANGQFSFSGLPGGSYTLKPSKLGYSFSPAEISLTLTTSLSGQNFTATQQFYSMTGTVYGRDGQALAGVTVSADSGQSAVSGVDGTYTLTNFPVGTTTLTANGNGYQFSPNSLTVRVPPSRTGVNFTSRIEGGLVGQVGGWGRILSDVIQNNLLLVGIGSRMLILDVTNRLHPAILWQSDPMWINGATQNGNKLYVMQSDGKTAIYNIADPMHPVLLGMVNHSADGISINNNLAYFVDWTDGLIITDVSDPVHPVDIGTLALGLGAIDVSVVGNRMYVASCTNDGALHTIDIADPTHPQKIDSVSVPGCASEIVIKGSYLYLATGSAMTAGGLSGLHIFSLANPDHPLEVSFLPTPEHDADLTVQGNIVYFGVREGGIRVIDVTDPTHPVQIGVLDTAAYVNKLAVVDHYIYAGDYFDGIRIADIADPRHPTEVGAFNPGAGNPGSADLEGDIVFLASGINGLEVFNVADPFQPTLVGRYNTPGVANDARVNWPYVYMANENSGLQIVDSRDPSHPVLAGSVDTPGSAKAVALADPYVYVADLNGGLQAVNISNPAHPVLTGELTGIGEVSDLAVAGGHVLLAGEQGLTIASLADPAHPQLVSSLSIGSVNRINLHLNFAYLSGWDNLLRIVDFSDPFNPRWVNTFATNSRWIDAQNITGHYLYLNQYSSSTQVYSLSDPIHPILAGSLPDSINAYSITVGCYAAYTFSSSGLEVVHTNLCEEPPAPSPIQLQLDQAANGMVTPLTSQIYQFTATAGQSLTFEVTPNNPADQLAVYLRFEKVADWIHHDLRSFEKTPSGSYVIQLSAAQAGNYYLAVYGQNLSASSGGYTVVVRSVTHQLTNVSPRKVSNTGPVTLTLSGMGFASGMNVELRSAGKPTLSAQSVVVTSLTQASALFNLTGGASGNYDLAVIFPGGLESSLAGAVTIQDGLGPQLIARLALPSQVRPEREYTLILNYRNIGGADLTVPTFTVSSLNHVPLSLVKHGPYVDTPVQISVTSSGLPGVLPPGGSGQVPVYFKVPSGFAPHAKLCFMVTVLENGSPRQLDLACTEVILPNDPNEKVGPVGNGVFKTVRNDATLCYMILFENQATASAPAQEVFITDTLDPAFDWTSFQVGEVRFGNQTVIPQQMAPGLYYVRLEVPDYRNEVTKAWWVDVTIQVNQQTGQIVWTLRTLDPDNGDLPEDALAGFLPPNDATQRGEGHVTFSIGLKPGLASGKSIKNQASITFDTNSPINTNLVANTVSSTGWLPTIYIPTIRR